MNEQERRLKNLTNICYRQKQELIKGKRFAIADKVCTTGSLIA